MSTDNPQLTTSNAFIQLMRLDKPVGFLLLLWPTYWALWIAADGLPTLTNFIVFTAGVIVMRSAGCVINDFADRKVDGHVERTRLRPLATGIISAKQAIILFTVLCFIAFLLVLQTNSTTIHMSFVAVGLATLYPFMKRFTHFPQVFLGAAFSWAIPMAFTAEGSPIGLVTWGLFIANLCWTVAYDTFYAMVDRDDDIKVGIKSTAVWFGRWDLAGISLLQAIAVGLLVLCFQFLELSRLAYVVLAVAVLYLIWLVWIARTRSREACFRAFKLSHWFGVIVFAAILIGQ